MGLSSINSSDKDLSDGEGSLAEKVEYWGNDDDDVLAGLDQKSNRGNRGKGYVDVRPKGGRRQTIDKLGDFEF